MGKGIDSSKSAKHTVIVVDPGTCSSLLQKLKKLHYEITVYIDF